MSEPTYVAVDLETTGFDASREAIIEVAAGTKIKVIEIVLGVTMLLNRAMPLTIIALVPINVVIVYWNFVLDEGGALTRGMIAGVERPQIEVLRQLVCQQTRA